MANTKETSVVKIAVQMEDLMPQLIEFDQQLALKQIIQELCNAWGITEPAEKFALQFSDVELKCYVTERNRNDIKNGSVLCLTNSPGVAAGNILEQIQFTAGQERRSALQKLAKQSLDPTFALEFIHKKGKDFLMSAIEEGLIKPEEGLGDALEAFTELMNHGLVAWDTIQAPFISKIANQVNLATITPKKSDCMKILIHSLAILESIIASGIGYHARIESIVTLPNLIKHVQQNPFNPEIQQNTIALINALFMKSDLSRKKAIAATLGSRQFRNVILNSVLSQNNVPSQNKVGSEMAHQLCVLQSLLFNLHEERMQAPMDADVKEKLDELCKLAFDSEWNLNPDSAAGGGCGSGSSRPLPLTSSVGQSQEDFLRLGFSNGKNPLADFNACPPGLLALDLMLYLARNYTELYVKVVLENCCRSDREHECPFARSSIQVTKLLAEITSIGESPSDEGKHYYPMFFTIDHPLEELFCICIPLLNKTWKEMKATSEDFMKVFSVLRQQITRALGDEEATSSLEKFRNKLSSLTYSEIMNLWQKERTSREEWENKAEAILELREAVKPEIMSLIKQQRLTFLCEGTLFVKYSNKGTRMKDKFWYCRLSNNHKFLFHGDADEKHVPTNEELADKLALIDVKALLTGRDCPHMKELKGKKSTSALAFSLVLDSEQDDPLNFVAPNQKLYDYWIDGMNALIGQEMDSVQTKQDLEILLSMDIKLRLLDTEGVTIPEVPPPIPPSPPNYDFNFKY